MVTSPRSKRAHALSSGLVALSCRIAPSGRPFSVSYARNESKGLVVSTPPKSHSTAFMSGLATIDESRASEHTGRLGSGLPLIGGVGCLTLGLA